MSAYEALAGSYDALTQDVPYEAILDYVEALLARHGRQPETVLDLACGTGSLAALLAQRGYRVLAADASENARKRAEGYLYGRRALLVPLPYAKAELEAQLGKSGCSMAACTDFGLSAAFLEALAEKAPEEYGPLSLEMERRADKAARRRAAGPKRKPGREHHE